MIKERKITTFIIVILMSLLLTSCLNSNYKITFNVNGDTAIEPQLIKKNKFVKKPDEPEKEGYVFLGWYHENELFDFKTKINKDIILEGKWEIDYLSLGFTKSFKDEMSITTVWDRTDGEVNPYKGKDIEILDPEYTKEIAFLVEGTTDEYIYYDPLFVYFDKDIYTHYRRWNTSRNGFYYVDTENIDGNLKLKFYADGIDPYMSMSRRPNALIDAIESNGSFGYIINVTYISPQRELRTRLFNLFYVIYHDETLPYTVYFTDLFIFLIPKDDAFDKTCIDVFNSSEEVHLFKE